MAKIIDESWKNWINENLELGVAPTKIFETLINNDFDINDIEKQMNTSSIKKDSNSVNKTLMNKRTTIEHGFKINVENNKLEIYQINNFLNQNECNQLIKIIKKNKTKSKVSIANKAEGYTDDSVRTSSTCNLVASSSNLDIVSKIDERILECIGIHSSRGEAIQGQHYDKTQEFKQHTDTFHPNSDEYKVHCENSGGQRTWTFMIYLNNTEGGGETKFNRVKKTNGDELVFSPTMGMAVVWNNLNDDGSPNMNSLHQGCPVSKGEKTIITKWFRERKI